MRDRVTPFLVKYNFPPGLYCSYSRRWNSTARFLWVTNWKPFPMFSMQSCSVLILESYFVVILLISISAMSWYPREYKTATRHGSVPGLQHAIFSSPEPKARVSYCHSASSVRLSVVVVVRPCPSVNFSHFRLLLQNRWINLVEIW